MGDKRRRFDPEFGEGAVRVVKETGKPVAQVARDLGINPCTLHNWVKANREHGGEGGVGVLNDAERRELAAGSRPRWLASTLVKGAEWEKQRAELEMEREVLKRSVVLWVKDSMNR